MTKRSIAMILASVYACLMPRIQFAVSWKKEVPPAVRTALILVSLESVNARCINRPYRPDSFTEVSGIVQELCESRGGRPGLSVLTSLLVSVDVKNY